MKNVNFEITTKKQSLVRRGDISVGNVIEAEFVEEETASTQSTQQAQNNAGATQPPTPQPTEEAAAQTQAPVQSESLWQRYGLHAICAVLVAVISVAVLWELSRNGEEKETKITTPTTVAAGVVKTSAIPGVTGVGTATLVVKADAPVEISIPPGHQWKLLDPIPEGWTTDAGHRDSRGYRIQKFEVVSPVTEVTLQNEISKCPSPQGCAW